MRITSLTVKASLPRGNNKYLLTRGEPAVHDVNPQGAKNLLRLDIPIYVICSLINMSMASSEVCESREEEVRSAFLFRHLT